MRYSSVIDYEKCIRCGRCERNCPGDVIHMDKEKGVPVNRYPDECWYCGACRMDCPVQCIRIVFPMEVVGVPKK